MFTRVTSPWNFPEVKVKKLLLLAALSSLSIVASASCYGTGSFQTCADNAGNVYNVQRYGNTTQMQGYGPNGNWSQTDQTIGNTTYHSGQAVNGNPWSGTTTNYPGMQVFQGSDSHGRPYQRTCTQFGCY